MSFAEAPLLYHGQHGGGLIVVDADVVVVELAQEVLRVPQGLVFRVLQDWCLGQFQRLLAVHGTKNEEFMALKMLEIYTT